MSAIQTSGDYPRNKEIVRLMMKYVGVYIIEPGRVQALITPELMNNHLGSWERGMSVEWAMMEYNCSFFRDGRSRLLRRIRSEYPTVDYQNIDPVIGTIIGEGKATLYATKNSIQYGGHLKHLGGDSSGKILMNILLSSMPRRRSDEVF